MKCLVINLDRSTERLANVATEFAKIGVPFERIAAVDAFEDLPSLAVPSGLTGSEMACFLSHRKCWQIIADDTNRYGAVFEDDVILKSDAGPLLSNDSWVPRDADIVKLETLLGHVRLGCSAPIGNSHTIAQLVGEHLGTAGYVISKASAQKLLRRTEHFKEPVDLTLFSPNSMTFALNKTYQLRPALCVQSRLVESAPIPTLIQMTHRRKGVATRILGDLSRLFGHCRNGTFWRTQKVDMRLGWTPDVLPHS